MLLEQVMPKTANLPSRQARYCRCPYLRQVEPPPPSPRYGRRYTLCSWSHETCWVWPSGGLTEHCSTQGPVVGRQIFPPPVRCVSIFLRRGVDGLDCRWVSSAQTSMNFVDATSHIGHLDECGSVGSHPILASCCGLPFTPPVDLPRRRPLTGGFAQGRLQRAADLRVPTYASLTTPRRHTCLSPLGFWALVTAGVW